MTHPQHTHRYIKKKRLKRITKMEREKYSRKIISEKHSRNEPVKQIFRDIVRDFNNYGQGPDNPGSSIVVW